MNEKSATCYFHQNHLIAAKAKVVRIMDILSLFILCFLFAAQIGDLIGPFLMRRLYRSQQ